MCVNSNNMLFRMPLKGELRSKWIDVISKEQEFHNIFTYFNVCSLHFNEQEVTKSGKLQNDSVPSIFR